MTENTPQDIPGLKDLQEAVEQRSQRVNAWDRFTEKIRTAILGGKIRDQTRQEVDTLLNAATPSASFVPDLRFKNALAVTEIRDSQGFSLGWDITFNCLAGSSGDFKPYCPLNNADYYENREQALIALAAWLNDQLEASYSVLTCSESPDEIQVNCPECNSLFVVDSDGDLIDSFPDE